MGLGGTAKKLQKVMDAAEQLYSKMNEIIGELKQLQTEVETTSEQVDRIERDLAAQRALLEAVADQQDIDVEGVVEQADPPVEPADSTVATDDEQEVDSDETAASASDET